MEGVTLRNESTGETEFIATRAVVVGTGGYINNEEMLREYTNYDIDRFVPLNHGHATGDGSRSMWSVGARKHRVGTLMVYGAFLKDSEQPTFAMMNHLTNAAAMQPLLWVNEKGLRFVNEDVVFNMVMAGNANLSQNKVLSILSQDNVNRLIEVGNFVGMGLAVRNGDKLDQLQHLIDGAVNGHKTYIQKANSLPELAEKLGVPADTLQKTIADYNHYAETQTDEQFGKPAEYLLKVEGGPFYGFVLSTCGFCSMGGVEVNTRNEVISEENGAIGGLYATGNESSGMLVGDSYDYTNGGLAVSYSFYSGRNAATNAAAYLKKRA
ncbi:FAD-binding protein [Rhizobium sp. YIC5082]|nr:FAD-binding protein [Rhizobium sp. YIC5082]